MAVRLCSPPFPMLAATHGCGSGRSPPRAATELPGTEGASYPFWSADSRFIGFFADGKLKRVAVAGGNPVIVCDAAAGRGGLWLDDDTIVFAPTRTRPLMRVNAAGGSAGAVDQRSPTTRRGTGSRNGFPARQLLYFSVNRAPEKSGTRLVAIDDPHRAIAFFQPEGRPSTSRGSSCLCQRRTGGPRPCSHSAWRFPAVS